MLKCFTPGCERTGRACLQLERRQYAWTTRETDAHEQPPLEMKI